MREDRDCRMTKIFITMKKYDAKFFSVLKNFDRE